MSFMALLFFVLAKLNWVLKQTNKSADQKHQSVLVSEAVYFPCFIYFTQLAFVFHLGDFYIFADHIVAFYISLL